LKNTSQSKSMIVFLIASHTLINLLTMKTFVANHVSIGCDKPKVGLY
jgi:hypothetical protein